MSALPAYYANGVPLVVDNTFATPINCRPFEWGCDIVTHSTTKYMDGHAAVVGGVVVDSGNFCWDDHKDKFPGLTTPDESYHGLTYTKAFGKGAYMTKLVAQLMRDLGAQQSPQNAFLLNLVWRRCTCACPPLRQCATRGRVSGLTPQGGVGSLLRLVRRSVPCLGQKYLPNGSCGVMSLGVKGDRDTAIKFMDSLRLINIVTHVADARTCVLHPASHTHRQLSDEQLRQAGIAPDLIRLSVGIEDVADIIADLEQALEQV